MKLSELEPRWLKRKDDTHYETLDSKEGANGIFFVCPKCLKEKGSRPGVHGIICWDPSVPQTTHPTPGRWELVGNSFEDLTLVAESSSIHLTGPGCGAHFLIQKGKIEGA